MSAADIAKALKARKNGAGWIAHCICHEDKTPSLSISEGSNGAALVHCHAGCPQEAVIEELRRRGLWRETGPARGLTVSELARAKGLPRSAVAREWL